MSQWVKTDVAQGGRWPLTSNLDREKEGAVWPCEGRGHTNKSPMVTMWPSTEMLSPNGKCDWGLSRGHPIKDTVRVNRTQPSRKRLSYPHLCKWWDHSSLLEDTVKAQWRQKITNLETLPSQTAQTLEARSINICSGSMSLSRWTETPVEDVASGSERPVCLE